jgi:hypothetical protein
VKNAETVRGAASLVIKGVDADVRDLGVLPWSSIGRLLRQKETLMPNVHELIRDHVTLSIRCLDRLYLHAYLPKLQTSGGLCYFLRDHRGHPIPSPALFAPMLERFVGAIKTYATTQDVPLVSFERGDRKDDVVADYRARRRCTTASW